MVRLTSTLLRVPVIKFRKGGVSHAGSPPSAPISSPAPAASAAAAPVQSQQTVTMSTISDIDLPPRYRRAPLSQEEIDHINGGGIEEKDSTSKNDKPGTLVFNMPKRIVFHCNKAIKKPVKPPCGCGCKGNKL